MDLSRIPTKDLVEELRMRLGVTEFIVPNPDCKYHIQIEGTAPFPVGVRNHTGPARILVVID